MKKYSYIVWIGGVDNYFYSFNEARRFKNEYVKKGYDDVILEKIGSEV